MHKRLSLHLALGLLVVGLVLTATGGYGYIQADAIEEGTKAVKALLAFGGSLITASVIMMALIVGA